MRRTLRLAAMLIAASAFAIVALGVYAFWIEPASLRVSRHELTLKRWPESLDGFRISVISDLHSGAPYIDFAKIDRVVEMSNETQPDLVLITGDTFVSDVRFGKQLPTAEIVRRLEKLSARLGVYLVFGNHDVYHERYRRLLEGSPVHLMDNSVRHVDNDGKPFWLIGLGDILTETPDIAGTLAQVTDDAPIIAFTHGPDLFPGIPARVNLVVAGHTHGGQVRLPFIGRMRVPSLYRQRFGAGHVVEDTDLFVSTGIGTSHLPVRFWVPPEISLLVLHGPVAP